MAESGKSNKEKLKILRWWVLLLVSLTIGANYYVYDALSSIKSTFQAELGFTNTEYGWIIAFYALPNLVMTLIGGIILDKWGIRKTGLLFVTLCVFGATLTAYGASDIYNTGGPGYSFMGAFLSGYSPELKMMITGRFLFGLGAETTIVVINAIMVKWFKGRELALAFGINVSIARIGTAAALHFSPIFATSSYGWTSAVWFAAILMGLGLVFYLIYIYFDKKGDRLNITDQKFNVEEEKFRFKDLGDLIKNRSYVYVIFLCLIFYSAVFPFLSYTPDLLYNKYGVSMEASGQMTNIIIYGSIIFTPLFGWLVDKKGKRATMMIFGSSLLLVVHLILSLTNITPYVPMFLLGIAFSLVPAAMWPSVALIVKENKIGTAYGLMTSLQNVGLFTFPALAGMILDATNKGITASEVAKGLEFYDYTYTVLMFAGLGLLGLVFAFLLMRAEKGKNNHGLEQPSID